MGKEETKEMITWGYKSGKRVEAPTIEEALLAIRERQTRIRRWRMRGRPPVHYECPRCHSSCGIGQSAYTIWVWETRRGKEIYSCHLYKVTNSRWEMV